MLNILRCTVLKRRSCRLYSQATTTSKKSGFDKSMIKPALIIIIFGSVLSHVSDQQKKNSELERRYELKMGILKELIDRAKQGDKSFDANEELKLVNKLFSRYTNAKDIDLEEEAHRIRKFSDSTSYSEDTILNSLNRTTNQLEDQSLEDILKSLMDEVNDVKSPKKTPLKEQLNDTPSNADEIVFNRKMLEEEAKRETRLMNYTPSTDLHTIVDNPGELSEAAKDTEITKFL